MNQKIWVINDQDWEDPSTKRRNSARPLTRGPQKNPALSFSLSFLVWGSGQMYVGERVLGSIFTAVMVSFYSVISCLVMFWSTVRHWVLEGNFPTSLLLAGSLTCFSLFFIVWMSNAVHGYLLASESRSEPFRGMDNALWTLIGSLLFPGWGQFLNGQPKKGLFFSFFGLVGYCSLLVLVIIWQFWPIFQVGPDMTIVEMSLVAAFSAILLSLLMWIISVHDAFWSCREPVRKSPIPKRLQFVANQVRMRGAVRALFPEIRSTVLLGLLFAALVMAGKQYIPWHDYLAGLEKVRLEMLNCHLEIIPDLLGNVMVLIER